MPMSKVLIANRGEIAVRIIRACRDYGVASVAVYADQDSTALYLDLADEAHVLDGRSPAQTYLDVAKLIAAARRSGADAVHPGYGFLAERADFARAVIAAGLTWIGPAPECIEALGDKLAARRIAAQVGAPLVPGTTDPVANADQVLAFAREHGLPIAIKAAFGGGGRGLKVARQLDEIEELYASAVREASAAFGRGECFVERFLDRPRHLEAQVLADSHGRVEVIGTRDCSLQRRNQKLVEEAPAPFLKDSLRRRLEQAAAAICRAAGYQSAGTVEFLLGAGGELAFLEVNTRLQVEHPVSEETSGLDLVVEQLRIADGLPLSFDEVPRVRGHSLEFRINAEDAARGFLPAPGVIQHFLPPSGPGIRVDSGVRSGSPVPGEFDSLLAKLIVTGADRNQAIARARRALAEFEITGAPTLLPFHRALLRHPDFTAPGHFAVHTRWIENAFQGSLDATLRNDPIPPAEPLRTFVEIDGRRHRLGLPAELLRLLPLSTEQIPQTTSAPAEQDESILRAPLAGHLHSWLVADGAQVAAGQPLAVLEAMKMETQLDSPSAGRLVVLQQSGSQVAAGTALGRIETTT